MPATAALALLRLFAAYSWLAGAFLGSDAKFSAQFLSGKGLQMRVNTMFSKHALIPAVGHWLPGFVDPNAALFAWLLAVGELVVGVSLVLGLLTRVGGLLTVIQAAINLLVAGGLGADTVGHNYLLILIGLAVMLTGAGRRYGLDALILRRFPHRYLRLLA
jgi:thiosulfate dehydrogenase [quinone] large subunit